MPEERVKIFVIILSWNGFSLTKKVLENLAGIDTTSFEVNVILVDNGSSDETSVKLKDFKLPNMGFELITLRENNGFAGGNNVGIKRALDQKADYVLLLNNDIEVCPDLVQKLYLVAKKDENIGAVSPKMYFAKGYEFHSDWYKKEDLGKVIWYAGGLIDWQNVYSSHRGVDEVDNGQYDKEVKTDFVNGACAFIKSEVLKKVGLFNEKYFLYWEDIDLSLRIKKAGYDLLYTPQSAIWHKVSSSAGGSGGKLNDYYLTRNRLRFGVHYASLKTKLALLKDSVRILLTGRGWQKKGVIDFYLGRFGKGRKII